MRNLSIRTKLIVLIIAATSVLLAGILAVISGNLQRQMARKVLSDFDKTQHYFKRQEALIYDRLVESCLLIGQNAAFKANVALNDGPSVQQAVEEFAQFTKTDLLVVTDHTGRVLGWLDNAAAFGEALGQRPGMERALAGQEPDWLLEEVLLWEIDGQLFQIVAAPIFAGVTLLGAIVMGTRFTDFEARYLKGASAIDICMFLDTILVGASIPDSDLPDKQEHLRRFRADYQSLIDATLTSGQTSEAFSARFAGEDVFAYVSPLGMGAPGYYLAFARKSTEMAFLRQLFQHIFFIGLGGFALAAIMALVLGNRFSRPVITLARAMDQVKQGSLDIALPVRSRDEFGQLTLAFNRQRSHNRHDSLARRSPFAGRQSAPGSGPGVYRHSRLHRLC
jgi:HAMP domain-containing protein